MQSSTAIDIEVDASKVEPDGSENDKKQSNFFCTLFPPCNVSCITGEHLARHILRKHVGERSSILSYLDGTPRKTQQEHVDQEVSSNSPGATTGHLQDRHNSVDSDITVDRPTNPSSKGGKPPKMWPLSAHRLLVRFVTAASQNLTFVEHIVKEREFSVSIRHVQGKVKEIFGSRRPKDLDFDPKLRPRDSEGMNQRIRAFMDCKEQWTMLKQRTRMSDVQLPWDSDPTRHLAHTKQDHIVETGILRITPSNVIVSQNRDRFRGPFAGSANSNYGPQPGKEFDRLGAYDSNLIQSFPDDLDDLMVPDWDDPNADSARSEHSLPHLSEPYLCYNETSPFASLEDAYSTGQSVRGAIPATKEDRKRARNREAQRLHRLRKKLKEASSARHDYSPRSTQACSDCRRRKVRCTGDRPSCFKCFSLGRQCIYTGTGETTRSIAQDNLQHSSASPYAYSSPSMASSNSSVGFALASSGGPSQASIISSFSPSPSNPAQLCFFPAPRKESAIKKYLRSLRIHPNSTSGNMSTASFEEAMGAMKKCGAELSDHDNLYRVCFALSVSPEEQSAHFYQNEEQIDHVDTWSCNLCSEATCMFHECRHDLDALVSPFSTTAFLDALGNTNLHRAVQHGRKTYVAKLLENNANPYAVNAEGMNPAVYGWGFLVQNRDDEKKYANIWVCMLRVLEKQREIAETAKAMHW